MTLTLVISSTSDDDNGIYTCQISNEALTNGLKESDIYRMVKRVLNEQEMSYAEKESKMNSS